jgi:hypothetical protein
MNKDQATSVTHASANPQCGALAVAPGSEIFLAATITGSNERKGSEMPAEGKGERQSAGTASGGSAQAPAFSDQKQDTPAGYFPNIAGQPTRPQA